jgi:DNA-binding transcriptional LysR family regulator
MPAIMQPRNWPINWNDLQDFLAVARAGRLARAGQTMGVDATTMGRRLRRLETRLGQTLFEQTREGHILTEAGDALLVRVEAMAQAAMAITDGGTSKADLTGTLRISVSEGFGTWFLSGQLPAFARTHPELTLDLVANSGFLSLSKRETDIAIMLSRPKAGPVIARKLSDYALGLYGSAEYLNLRSRPLRPQDLAEGHSLVGYIPDLIYAPELRYLDEFHPGLRPHLRSSSINAQHQLIAAGAGIGVLPCFIGDADPRILPVLPDHPITRTFWLVTHKDTHQLARVRAAKDWLLDCVQRHRSVLVPPR